jgi:hypothetical protein
VRLVRDRDEWDVQLEGLLVRLDRPGAPSHLRRFASADDARAGYLDEIDARLAEGYVEAPDPATDREARLVYADELQLRGDPLGELIAVHRELELLSSSSSSSATAASDAADARHRKRLEHRAAAIIDEHHDAWFGGLARFVKKPSRKPPATPLLEIGWRLGFAEDVHLRGSDQLALDAAYARLRELPLSRQILRLALGAPNTGARPPDQQWPPARGLSYEPLTDAMLEHGIPSRLAELVIGDDEAHRRPGLELGDLRAVVAAAPALETLRIVGGHGGIALASDRLRVLEICDVTADDLRQLARSQLPAIEEVMLRARTPIGPPAVFELWPQVSRLTLEGFTRPGSGAQPLLEHLAEAIPGTLRILALPRCRLDDDDLAAVIREPERFGGLARLDLRRNRFSRGLAALARRRVPVLRVASSPGS